MTYITQEQAVALAKEAQFGNRPIIDSPAVTLHYRKVQALCNAAIQHYLDSQPAPLQEGRDAARLEDDAELWLWRNGDHMLAFKHLYPCFTPGGDPMTLGEPFGRAVFRISHDRAAITAGDGA